jgi:hypothetical protein
LLALRALLDAKDVARFEFPRDVLRELSASLPDLSSNGFDFSFVSSLPALETSSLSAQFWDDSPESALREVCSLRGSGSVRAKREEWLDLLFAGTAMCGIGGTNIQIVRDTTVHGNLVQEQRFLRAVPVR